MTVTTLVLTHTVQTYTVPPNVTFVTFECWAAQGGRLTLPGAKGGYAGAQYVCNPGDQFDVVIGEHAVDVNAGYGGGGQGGDGVHRGYGGGGASYVTRHGSSVPLIVAGGGGGASSSRVGGEGGGASGVKGEWIGGWYAAASQTYGYALWTGGNGGNGTWAGGGGGGGYWGGHGGPGTNGGSGGGGNGGSGYIDHTMVGGVMKTGFWSGHGQVVITAVSVPPLAPTVLTPTQSEYVISPQTIPLTWRHNAVDLGGYQTKADLQYKISGGAWVQVLNCATTVSAYTVPAGTWPTLAAVEIQVRTYGASGSASPWSASTFAYTLASIPAPTITSPLAGSDQFSTPVMVTWTLPDGFSQEKFNIARISPDGLVNYYQKNGVISSATNAMVPLDASPGRTDKIWVGFWYHEHFSAWASVDVVSQYGPPAPPLLVLTQQTAPDGSGLPVVDIAVTNPPASLGYADTVVTDLYRGGIRIAANLPNNSTFTDLLPGATATYMARAFAASGGSADSV